MNAPGRPKTFKRRPHDEIADKQNLYFIILSQPNAYSTVAVINPLPPEAFFSPFLIRNGSSVDIGTYLCRHKAK